MISRTSGSPRGRERARSQGDATVEERFVEAVRAYAAAMADGSGVVAKRVARAVIGLACVVTVLFGMNFGSGWGTSGCGGAAEDHVAILGSIAAVVGIVGVG